jgi:hypothetical protein
MEYFKFHDAPTTNKKQISNFAGWDNFLTGSLFWWLQCPSYRGSFKTVIENSISTAFHNFPELGLSFSFSKEAEYEPMKLYYCIQAFLCAITTTKTVAYHNDGKVEWGDSAEFGRTANRGRKTISYEPSDADL